MINSPFYLPSRASSIQYAYQWLHILIGRQHSFKIAYKAFGRLVFSVGCRLTDHDRAPRSNQIYLCWPETNFSLCSWIGSGIKETSNFGLMLSFNSTRAKHVLSKWELLVFRLCQQNWLPVELLQAEAKQNRWKAVLDWNSICRQFPMCHSASHYADKSALWVDVLQKDKFVLSSVNEWIRSKEENWCRQLRSKWSWVQLCLLPRTMTTWTLWDGGERKFSPTIPLQNSSLRKI